MNLFHRFLKEEDGAELIEIAIGIGIVALLAIGAWNVAQSAEDTLRAAGEQIQGITDDINDGSVPGTSGTSGSSDGYTTGVGGSLDEEV